ncbi:hypothetical protein [Aquabacterium sp.]|uniref:hypothetical protein n=1 Tax=Aquabacterium sp. TaxID=1872578 RepID=UPI0035B04936
MNHRSHSLIVLSAALLAGCAVPKLPGSSDAPAQSGAPTAAPAAAPTSGATLPEPSLAPPNAATAVQLTSYSIDGRVMPVMRGQQLIETRADMRRTDSVMGLDNRLLNAMVGDTRSGEIVRLDKKLVWTLHPAKQTYRECPLAGCTPPRSTSTDKPARRERAEEPAESSCPLTLKRNEFKVQATGERKTINAFGTERFLVTWTVEMVDKQKRGTVNSVVLDMWTTPEAGPVRDVRGVQDAFQRRWLAALGATDHPFAHYVPRDVMASLGGLMRAPGGTKGLAAWATEMKKVHGYPIVLTLSWNAEGNACADDAGGSSAKRGTPTSVSGLLGGLMADKAQDMARSSATGALLTYSYEVKSLGIKAVSDSSFVPDPAYTRQP